jgi:stress response protein SCP2
MQKLRGVMNSGSGRPLSIEQPSRDVSPSSIDMENDSEVPPPPMAPQLHEIVKGPYALADEDYIAWKNACLGCKKNPNSLDLVKALSNKPELLRWRSPVTGQTLLHEMVAGGASEATLAGAVELGCDHSLVNSKGETAEAMLARKSNSASGFKSTRSLGDSRRSTLKRPRFAPVGSQQQRQLLPSPSTFSSPPALSSYPSGLIPVQRRNSALANPLCAAAPQQMPPSTYRKKGRSLACGEKAAMPQASINLNLDLNQEDTYDPAALQAMVQKAYGGSAQVQIDEVSEAKPQASRVGTGRWQNVKCRVLCDSAVEAKEWLQNGGVQERLSTAMNVNSAVEFETAAKVDDVDAITLKLDSDSAHILCGACLLYTAEDECQQVVCYSDRRSTDNSVQHSGDTQVNGKSVHTISVLLSKVPVGVTQLYFTLCSCGPSDLSEFTNPSIMLYQNSAPDANLLEYSINQAEKSASCVMARIMRQPLWRESEVAMISRVLRRLRVPLLCLDLIMAMAEESSWSIQALGTQEWNITENICSNYHHCQSLIEERLRTKMPASSRKAHVPIRVDKPA